MDGVADRSLIRTKAEPRCPCPAECAMDNVHRCGQRTRRGAGAPQIALDPCHLNAASVAVQVHPRRHEAIMCHAARFCHLGISAWDEGDRPRLDFRSGVGAKLAAPLVPSIPLGTILVVSGPTLVM